MPENVNGEQEVSGAVVVGPARQARRVDRR
jgi:hypothetical protein